MADLIGHTLPFIASHAFGQGPRYLVFISEGLPQRVGPRARGSPRFAHTGLRLHYHLRVPEGIHRIKLGSGFAFEGCSSPRWLVSYSGS